MKKSKSAKGGILLMVAGLSLLVAAGVLIGYNLWEDERAGNISYGILQQFPVVTAYAQGVQEETEDDLEEPEAFTVPLYVTNPDMEMPTVEIEGNDYIGRLDIPALDLSLPIMDQWSYPGLKIAPGRYDGSAYQNNLIIAGHNYETHFGQLRNLRSGDKVIFTDADGNVFNYEVVEIEQLSPDEVEEMKDGGWALTLFTCTIGGKYRVTVRCVEAAA